ncbi:NDR1/HIN1-like protein 13 [Sorghum bicolor]|uniref:Late embryogenesis abundant protein LEA-2 subgroup domain-containing protein n=1 Tax=Sorghum bicolor TaxID=4558 RepID=C5YUE9_SORBI|nr:NDR1/HIN1-like protein 13 [Sorghum bicolor]EES19193.1 hypothetical protein SORBI_3009G073300 [Sorghum bicolor]|eukprot:XP_002440763.1 NDR1/HIN1-like protein 13 [Sorghum bicolor]
MADRVYPAAKPNPPPGAATAANGAGTGNGNAAASFPAPKSQMYQRPIYRPQAPAKRRRGRSCRCSFCCCFCWALLAIILLAFVAAVAGGAFYLLYRPQRPSFTVSSVRLASLNLTSSPTAPLLTDAITLTVTARNPNKKMVYLYDDLTVSVATAANAVSLGSTTVPGFTHAAGNTTVVTATVSSNAVTVDPSGAGSDIKRSGAFSVVVDADTSAGVRVGGLKTKKIGIQVHCEGIKVTPPPPAPAPAPKRVKGKNSTVALAPAPAPAADAATTRTAATVSTAAHSCKVRVRVKIWKWTF